VRLRGRTAIVCGSSQGIGLAVAARFAAEGANVVRVDLKNEVSTDVTSAAQVDEMVTAVMKKHGQIDILVNNAGGSGAQTATEIEAVSEEIWDRVVDLNLKSAYLCCRAVIPHMKARKYGRIVNVSSGIAKGQGRAAGTAGAVLPYAAAKAGVLGLTFTLAKLVAASGITVNAVVPGFVLTEPGARVRDWFDRLPAEAQGALVSRTSMGRAGEPGEIAAAILFLASDESSFITGHALVIDGGQTLDV